MKILFKEEHIKVWEVHFKPFAYLHEPIIFSFANELNLGSDEEFHTGIFTVKEFFDFSDKLYLNGVRKIIFECIVMDEKNELSLINFKHKCYE